MLVVLKEDKGSGLVLILIVMMLMVVLGTGVLAAMGTEGRQAAMHDNRTQAYYLARSGAEIAHEWLKMQDYNLSGDLNFNGTLQGLELGVDNTKPININMKKEAENIIITSTGRHNGITETVGIQVQYTSEIQLTSFTHALFSSSRIVVGSGAASITGDVATNFTAQSLQINLGNRGINGDLYVLDPTIRESDIPNLHGKVKLLSQPLYFPLPEFPVYPSELPIISNPGSGTLTLNGDYQMLGTLSSRTINVGNQDRKLVVDSLNLNTLTIEGTGKLTIYVKDSLELRGAVNNRNKMDQLIIYIKGSGSPSNPKEIEIRQADIYASIHAEDANIKFSNTNSKFYGHIITGGAKIEMNGNSSASTQAIYAPNAHVDLSGGAEILGVVVAKELTMSGNSKLVWDDVSKDSTLETLIETKTYQMMWR